VPDEIRSALLVPLIVDGVPYVAGSVTHL